MAKRKQDESAGDFAIRRACAILKEHFGSATLIVPSTDDNGSDTLAILSAGHATDVRGHVWQAYVMLFEDADGSRKRGEDDDDAE